MTAVNSQIRIAVDGFDGLGKTTLTRSLLRQLSIEGVTVQAIGRRAADCSETSDTLTNLVKAFDARELIVSHQVNAYVRMARLYDRIQVAENSSAEVIVFDRWIVSDLSRLANMHQCLPDFLTIHERANIQVLVRMSGDFSIAWDRISMRDPAELSPLEKLGQAHLRPYFQSMDEAWSILPHRVTEICSAGDLDTNTSVVIAAINESRRS